VNHESGMLELTRRRTEEIFAGLQRQIFVETDRLFAILMALQWVFGIVIAYVVSPRAWAGSTSGIHIHVWAAIFLGGAISSFPIMLALTRPGRLTTRYSIAIGQMLTSSLLIHLTGGRIETHFHVFGSLAFLAFYRDWRVLVPATIVIAGDHLLRGLFWPQSVYGVLTASTWRSLEHAGWVVFEDLVLVVSCMRGTRELRRVAERTAEFTTSEERYKAVVGQTSEGIFVFDVQDHAILECNAAFATMLGTSPDVVTELTVGDVMTSGAHAADLAPEGSLGHATMHVAEHTFRRLDGTVIDVECSLSPTVYGRKQAVCAVVRDIRARKRIEADLANARDAAVELVRVKSEFLANMSHEIRTPMNGITGMIELALDSGPTAEQREYLTTMKSATDSLLTLLNGVLDFSKIESGKLELESVAFSPTALIADTMKSLATEAEQKGLELAYDVGTDVPAGIIGDPLRLRQVLTNLVSNAIKFTARGRVILEVTEERRRDDTTRLHVVVRDTGIGIPLEKHATIFEAFSQADGSTTRRFGGTGLGLTISSALVHLMGGKIWVESEPGAGSAFHFTACFDTAELGQPAPAAEPRARSPEFDSRAASMTPAVGRAARPLEVLLAEDNIVNQRVAVGLLARRGHVVTVANNGLEALAALESRTFDMMLMDVQMPEMSGLEATAEIRRRERQRGGHLRIVAMTAHAMNGDRERCLAAGMDGYLTKPIDPAMLYATVELEAASGALPRGSAPPPTLLKSTPVDRDLALQRLDGDEGLFSEVIQLFLEDCPARLAAIKAALDRGDADAIRVTAHGLKGAAGNLSATGLFEAANTLERLGAERRIDAARAAWHLLSAEAAAAMDALRQFETVRSREPIRCAD
jgi:two-component system sensor histidine kinase/response regulator